jgi:putative membrane protein
VKDFANRMITDHGKAGDELKPIAQEMNVTLPQIVIAEHQTSKRVWQPGSGSHGA